MVEIENFIGTHDTLLTKEQCDAFINFFEETKKLGLTWTRQQANDMEAHQKNDEAMIITELTCNPGSEIIKGFADNFWDKLYIPYIEKYSVLKFAPPMGILSIKIQKTEPTQGYHIWHYEDSNIKMKGRVLTFLTYLNDVECGGETEFLYLSKRIAPTVGKTLLWPAGFTHTHRGNPPLSGTKYILTGWIEWSC